MTETERDLYIELQDVFAPFRGEWQVGDLILRKADKKVGVIFGIATISDLNSNERVTALQIKFPFVNSCVSGSVSIDLHVIEAGGFAWIPRIIDTENPGRGIIPGMFNSPPTLWPIGRPPVSWECEWVEVWSMEMEERTSEGHTPAEALLRAIKTQKEGKCQ